MGTLQVSQVFKKGVLKRIILNSWLADHIEQPIL